MTAETHNFFVCTECHREVYSFPWQENPPTVCATCLWLDEFVEDPAERERMRRELSV